MCDIFILRTCVIGDLSSKKYDASSKTRDDILECINKKCAIFFISHTCGIGDLSSTLSL